MTPCRKVQRLPQSSRWATKRKKSIIPSHWATSVCYAHDLLKSSRILVSMVRDVPCSLIFCMLGGNHVAEAVTAASQCRAERRERSCRNVDVKKSRNISLVQTTLLPQASPSRNVCFSWQLHGLISIVRAVTLLSASKKIRVVSSVKTTHERCGPVSLVVLNQRRGRVTTSSGPTLSETLSSKASAEHFKSPKD